MKPKAEFHLPAEHLTVDEDLNLRYLQVRLASLDLRLRREVQRWQLAGQDPGDAFRGLYISDEQANALLDRPLATSWGQMAGKLAPAERSDSAGLAKTSRAAERLAAEARRAGCSLRLDQLAQVFGLTAFEQDVFLVCLAPMLDLRYERLYGYLQDDVTRKRPSVNLALDLLCEAGPQRLLALAHFAEDAALFYWRLLGQVAEPGAARPTPLNQALSVDETVMNWLVGSYRPPAELGAGASFTRPESAPGVAAVAEPILEQIQAEGNALLVFHGPEQESQDAAARLAASRRGSPLLTVDLAEMETPSGEIAPLAQRVRLALRDACMNGAVLYLKGWDACLVDGMPPASLFAELCNHPGQAILAGQAAWQPNGVQRSRRLFRVYFPLPDYPQRVELWSSLLESRKQDPGIGSLAQEGIPALAARFALSTAQIRAASAAAHDLAAQRGIPLNEEDLFAAARAVSSPHLSGQARKIVPRYDWDDIVLPEDRMEILKELVAAVRGRPVVLDTWGAGKKLVSSAGITALFAGPPGTGKTMAAEVIAAELGLDLYKIDLSTVVSKYIGETEKNLEAIFSEAASSNAILFFDEADALFGKRSEVRDAHDRYANIEISYLLQRMESYDGVTILATNLRANLDEAFTRRLQFAVDFPFPGAERPAAHLAGAVPTGRAAGGWD